jgi:hypothetical protein
MAHAKGFAVYRLRILFLFCRLIFLLKLSAEKIKCGFRKFAVFFDDFYNSDCVDLFAQTEKIGGKNAKLRGTFCT